jgi:MFS family permease
MPLNCFSMNWLPFVSDQTTDEVQARPETAKPRLFTKAFCLAALACFGFFTSYHMLSPSLPIYLKAKTALEPSMGFILSAFLVSSLCFRPWVGRWCEQYGPLPWMLTGATLFTVSPLLYDLVSHSAWPFWALVALRMCHGAGLALFYTSISVYFSWIIPFERRAEGMSHFSNAVKLATGLSPALGLYFAQNQQFNTLFGASTVAGAITLGALLWLVFTREIHWGTRDAQLSNEKENDTPKPKPRGLIHPKGILPGVLMGSQSLVFGCLIPYIPLLMAYKHLDGFAGWFYPVYAACLMLSRGTTGPLSDHYSRSTVIIPGMVGVSIALVLLYFTHNPLGFLLASGFYGLCAGTVQPSLMAVVADATPKQERGTAMATFTLLSDLGQAIGTFAMGSIGPIYGYANGLLVAVGVSTLGAIGFAVRTQAAQKKYQRSHAYQPIGQHPGSVSMAGPIAAAPKCS